MDNERFLECVASAVHRSVTVLNKKEKEYSSGKDRLDQFYRAGHVQAVTPTEALIGMATKHYTSICDMAKNPTNYTIKQWREKLDDLRNYTFLLDALVTEVKDE